MAHYREKKIMKRKRKFVENISRIPYNEESFEWYMISPSPKALEEDLEQFLKAAFSKKELCFDGQNSNMFDKYIDSWKNLALARLNTQKIARENKIANLCNIRNAVRKNAVDWLVTERKELEVINEEISELEKKYQEFLLRNLP